MTQQENIHNLIRIQFRRLQLLKEQRASFGSLNTPAHILIEIEDIETEIHKLQVELEIMEDDAETLEQRIEKQRRRIINGLVDLRQQKATMQSDKQKRVFVVGHPPLGMVAHFKNRIQEQTKISHLLAKPTTRLVSIVGHGGMGKTALASKVLRDLEYHRGAYVDNAVFLDGIIYLSTRMTGITLERVFLDCAKILDDERKQYLNNIWTNPALDVTDKILRLFEALQDGYYVILLDNLEDLLNDNGHLVDDNLQTFLNLCLTNPHGIRLLITSRIALAFQRGVMRFDNQVKLLDGLPIEDGVVLLRELDPNGDYGLKEAPNKHLVQAVSLVHGVPRALEIIAGILANDPFTSLSEVMETFYDQEDVVQALIKENYKRLTNNMRRVIEALAVFRRPISLLAVDYLLEPFIPGLDVPNIIQHLIRTNTVSVNRATKTIILHPIDQDYAYSQLLDKETNSIAYKRQSLERRAADYYDQLRSPIETWKSIYDIEPQLIEFDHRIRAKDYSGAYWVLDLIDRDYLYMWGHYSRIVDMRQTLLGKLQDANIKTHNLGNLGDAYYFLGQFDKSIEFYNKALLIAHEAGNRQWEGTQNGRLGRVHQHLGLIEQAIDYYREALIIAREIGDRQTEAQTLGNMGVSFYYRGQIEKGNKFQEESLSIAREIGDYQQEIIRLGNLGGAYYKLGLLDKAIKFNTKALGIARKRGDRMSECNQLSYLGNAYCAMGQVEQGINFYQEGLTLTREIGYRRRESYCLLWLSKALLVIKEFPKAQKYCVEAINLNIPMTIHQSILMLGIIFLYQDNLTADDKFEKAIVRCQAMLEKTPDLYESRYTLATALVGKAVCSSGWIEKNERGKLLVPALKEYQRASDICDAPGIIQNALQDLELMHVAGIEGLESVVRFLNNKLKA